MDTPVVVLDACRYSVKENGTCILRGWMYTGEEEPFVQVRADHIPLECKMNRTVRLDVLSARPDLAFPDEKAGFEIRIPNLEQIFSIASSLCVRICCDGEAFPIMQKEMEQVKTEYLGDSLQYHFDCVERRQENVHVEGWCVDTAGGFVLEVLDEKNETVKDVHISNVRRMDLCGEFEARPDQCQGYSIDIPRDSIKGKKLRFVFSNRAVTKEEAIKMKKFDRENTRLGHMLKIASLENRSKNHELIQEMGMRGFMDYLREESGALTDAYGYYARKHRASAKELKRQAEEKFEQEPYFSIVVPLYHTPEKFLGELIDSVRTQSYGKWQLCLADGSEDDSLGNFIRSHYGNEERISYEHLKENKGIAGNTNAALAMAKGDYIVFADHDDTLEPEALYQAVKVLRDCPEAELIYTDEDLMDTDGNYMYPHFKPDFNLDFLRCINYICHLVIVRADFVEKVGALRSDFDGAQDYDFLLRCAEQAENIRHIPKVLYHWRCHEQSTAGNQDSKHYAVDAGLRALEEHYERLGIEAEVEFTGVFIMYRTKFKVQGNPKVSILIPNKDHIRDLEKCISSIRRKSTWKNYEIIVIENNSEKEETFVFYEGLTRHCPEVKVVKYEGGFNYSAINNFGAKYAEGDYFLLLNNDTEVLTPDWMERMLGYCQREDVAITGAKLYYPDDTVQHAGVVIGMGGFAGHILTGFGKNYDGYMGRLRAAQDLSAVTAACLMVKRSVYETLHGLDEEFTVALNDVDFCLRARELGKLVVFQPDAKLYHYESKSRGLENTPEKLERFAKEISRFKERHAEILSKGDPYYNPNLSLVRGDCSLRKTYETLKGR